MICNYFYQQYQVKTETLSCICLKSEIYITKKYILDTKFSSQFDYLVDRG